MEDRNRSITWKGRQEEKKRERERLRERDGRIAGVGKKGVSIGSRKE